MTSSSEELIAKARAAVWARRQKGEQIPTADLIEGLVDSLAARDAVIAEVASLVMNTDGDWLGGDTFGGLTGEIQGALGQFSADALDALVARDAEKWDEGFDAGERDVMGHYVTDFDHPCIPNPYRTTPTEGATT